MKIVTTTLTALFLALGATTVAQPGSLDDIFGTNGKVITDFGTFHDRGYSVAIQPDGKIVIAGESNNGSDRDFAIARYNTDGTLDDSFSAGGKVTTDFGMSEDYGKSVAIQEDGRIVVAGYSSNGTDDDFALARYNTNGGLDSSFGGDGKVTTDFGTGHDDGNTVAIQSDGKIVVAGSSDIDLAIARYNTDGTLDNSFGLDGKVTTAFGTGSDRGRSVAIQPDGRIIVAGDADNGSDIDLALARYNTDGTLDNNFGLDGKVITDFGAGHDYGRSVAIQPDGKILIAGESNFDFALARYNTDGTLDNTFGTDGKVTTDFGSYYDAGNSVAIQPDGRIVVVGFMLNGPDRDFALARYNTDGTLDSNFGLGGKVTTALGTSDDYGYSVAIQPDGMIVMAGFSGSTTGSDFAVARYLSGLNVGIIDLSIANNAPIIYPNPIDKHATLEYTLQHTETLFIHMLDMQGRTVQTFVEGQKQAAGKHQQTIDLAEDLPEGSYLIAISSPKGRLTVQVVK